MGDKAGDKEYPASGQGDAPTPAMILAGAGVLINDAEIAPFTSREVAKRVFLAMLAKAEPQ